MTARCSTPGYYTPSQFGEALIPPVRRQTVDNWIARKLITVLDSSITTKSYYLIPESELVRIQKLMDSRASHYRRDLYQ